MCRSAAIEGLADVVISGLFFANRTGIDIATIAKELKQKVEKNAKKYSVAQYKGQL